MKTDVSLRMMKKLVLSTFLAQFAAVASAVPTLGTSGAIAPDPTFGVNGFARLTVPTKYARVPVATYAYPDGRILIWTADSSTGTHVASWLAQTGTSLDSSRPALTLDIEVGNIVNRVGLSNSSAAIVSNGAGAFGFFYSGEGLTGTVSVCVRMSETGVAEKAIAIEAGKITQLRDNYVLVDSAKGVFRYRPDCSLDEQYGFAGKLNIGIDTPIAHANGEVTLFQHTSSELKMQVVSATGATALATVTMANPIANLDGYLLRGAPDGKVWIADVSSDKCELVSFDPRIGGASVRRYPCPDGYRFDDFVYTFDARPWFGFLEDGATPITARFGTGNSFDFQNGRSVIYRLDAASRSWQTISIPFTPASGTPSLRIQNVIHRAAQNDYIVTATLNAFDGTQLFSSPLPAQVRTLISQVNADSTNRSTEIGSVSPRASLIFGSMEFTADNRLTLASSINDGAGIKDIVGSLELNGSPRPGFASEGVFSAPRSLRCKGSYVALTATATGMIASGLSGAGGSLCNSPNSAISLFNQTGQKTEVQYFSGQTNASPGMAVSAQGGPVLATLTNSNAGIDFFRFGVDSESKPITQWKTGLTPTSDLFERRVILRANAAGGFVAAHAGLEGIKFFSLNENVQPQPSFGSATRAEFFIAQPGIKALLAMEVLSDGVTAAVVALETEVRTYYVDGKGGVGYQVVADTTSTTWIAGVHANGDTVAATESSEGTLRIVRSRRANLRALPVVINDVWEWKTGANFTDAVSLAVHPTEEFAYLSVRLQKNSAANVADDNVIVKFDLRKASPAILLDVVAFYNTTLNHYFVSAGIGEIKSVDTGGAGPGWVRTTGSFKAFDLLTGIPASAKPVCRFYGTPGRGPNSHFYTFAGEECEAVKKDPGWTYEGIAFHIYPPFNGACAAGLLPVYRTYNNGFTRNDSNHRYSTDKTALVAMTGWSLEGVVFCSPQ
jgi:hypothetical protein